MGTNDCRECRALLSPFIEGELPPKEAANLARHLEICRECRREMEELRRTVELLRGLPQEPAPPEILRGVREAIRRPSLRTRWESWTFAWWPRAVAQAAVVLLVGLTVVLVQQRLPVLREVALQPPRLEPAAKVPLAVPPAPSSPSPAPREDRVQRLKVADTPAGRQVEQGHVPPPSAAEGAHPVPGVRKQEESPAASLTAPPLPDQTAGGPTSGESLAGSPEKTGRETANSEMTGKDKPSRPYPDAAPLERKASSPEVRPLSMPMMQYQQQAASAPPPLPASSSPPPAGDVAAPSVGAPPAVTAALPATDKKVSAAADRGTLPRRKERELSASPLKKAGGGQVADLEQESAAVRARPETSAGLLLCLRAPAGYDWLAGLTGLARGTGVLSALTAEAVGEEDRRRLNDLAGGEGTVASLVFTLPAANRDDLLRALRERTPLAILDQRETGRESSGGDIRITLLVWQAPR
jgi:hypothetical protein